MLKELFEAHFYRTFRKVENKVLMLDERTVSGDFSLLDSFACQGCKYVCDVDPAAREQLKVHSEQPVYTLSINQVFSFVSDAEEVGEICDYMIEGDKSSTLVEMTCSTTDYVKDKRQKARRQLHNTLVLLFANPIIGEHIQNKLLRYAVFSWKETFPENEEMDSVERSMMEMTLMTDEVYSPDNESNFSYGFKLREIRYPDVLICA